MIYLTLSLTPGLLLRYRSGLCEMLDGSLQFSETLKDCARGIPGDKSYIRDADSFQSAADVALGQIRRESSTLKQVDNSILSLREHTKRMNDIQGMPFPVTSLSLCRCCAIAPCQSHTSLVSSQRTSVCLSVCLSVYSPHLGSARAEDGAALLRGQA